MSLFKKLKFPIEHLLNENAEQLAIQETDFIKEWAHKIVDCRDYLTPEFYQLLTKELQLGPFHAKLFCGRPFKSLPIHIDGLEGENKCFPWGLNIAWGAVDNSVMHWYNVPEGVKGEQWSPDHKFAFYKEEDVTIRESVFINAYEPVITKIDVPHTVFNPNPGISRFCLSIRELEPPFKISWEDILHRLEPYFE